MSLVLLVDDRVDGDRGLADRAVADDEFALAAAEREQRIDDDKAGLDRLGHEIPVDDRRARRARSAPAPPRRWALCRRAAGRADRRCGRAAQVHRHAHHVAGAAHGVAGFDRIDTVEQDAADRGRGRAHGRSRTGPCRTAGVHRAATSGNPETIATPSPTSSTRPICSVLRAERGRAERGARLREPGVGAGVRAVRHVRGPRELKRDRRARYSSRRGGVRRNSSPAISALVRH